MKFFFGQPRLLPCCCFVCLHTMGNIDLTQNPLVTSTGTSIARAHHAVQDGPRNRVAVADEVAGNGADVGAHQCVYVGPAKPWFTQCLAGDNGRQAPLNIIMCRQRVSHTLVGAPNVRTNATAESKQCGAHTRYVSHVRPVRHEKGFRINALGARADSSMNINEMSFFLLWNRTLAELLIEFSPPFDDCIIYVWQNVCGSIGGHRGGEPE